MAKSVIAALAAVVVAATPGSPAAEVLAASENALVISHRAEIGADARAVWATLIEPRQWWSAEHTWSGNAANLALEPRAGGCFCETLPAADTAPAGSAERLRVIHVQPGRLLRLSGALGPLQEEGLAGTLSITLEPLAEGRTAMRWTYTVSGYRAGAGGLEVLAQPVDNVLAQQGAGLVAVAQAAISRVPAAPVDTGRESH